MNIKNTLRVLALCVSSLVSGMTYGQRINNTWVAEKWEYGEYHAFSADKPKPAGDYYLLSPVSNTFLKYESEVTKEPREATKFTISDEDHSATTGDFYRISCYDGSRRVYMYSYKGVARWGDDYEKQWCINETDASLNHYEIWQYDPDGTNDPRSIMISEESSSPTGYVVVYAERKLFENDKHTNDWAFISEAQYNALYPENLIRESLGYNKIQCKGVYYPNSNGNIPSPSLGTIESYKSSNGTWLSRIHLNKEKGIRLGTKIDNLVVGETYTIEVYVYATMGSDANKTTYTKNAALIVNNDINNPNYFDAIKTTGCSAPIVKTIDVTPDANGSICLGIWQDATEYIYFGIKSIKYKESLYTPTITDLSKKYYLYNIQADKFLDAGSTNGNTAIVGHGLDLKLTASGQNYTIDTKFSGNPTYNYFNGTSVNGAEAPISFISENNYFRMRTYENYIYVDGSTVFSNKNAGAYESGKWMLISEDQRKRDLKRATVDNPKDATFLVKQPGFSKYNCELRPYSSWNGYNGSTMTQDGADVNNGANCHLKITSGTFDIYQDLHTNEWDVPNGLYLVSAQGLHNDPNNLKPIVELYANEVAVPFVNLEGSNMVNDGVVAANNFTNGMYKTSLLVVVEDGKLRVGARGFAKDGETGVDNFEVTYYGKYDTDNMDVTTLFITNPSFQGSKNNSQWSNGWTMESYGQNIGNNNMNADGGNTYQGYGYFADSKGSDKLNKWNAFAGIGGNANADEKGSVYQKIYLPAGAYSLSAKCVAQNNPGFLFVKDGDYTPSTNNGKDMGQHITFIDKANGAEKRVTNPTDRTLIFIVPVSGYVTVGYRHDAISNADGAVWNAVDDFRLIYLGNAKNTNISCQIVNPDMDANNHDLPIANFGWNADGSNGFEYKDECVQRYNCNFDTYQTITGLPNGWYQIDVQGFYRDRAIGNTTKEKKHVFLYGNKAYKQINLIEAEEPNSTDYSDSGYPIKTSEAQTAFGKGRYPNSLITRVTDGTLKIGVVKNTLISADWSVFDNFKLTYLFSDTNIEEGMEFTQFIKNPSFETADYTAWETSKLATIEDNKNKDVMTNGVERYIANTGSQSKLGYYHIKQTISGTKNGLPQGQYVLKAKVSSVEDNDIAVFANGRLGSFVTDGTNKGREIELGSIGINNNEEVEISFTSNYGFNIDDIRLTRSSREGEGDALIVDLDGLIAQAKAILESGFVGDGAFQIDGTELQTAYNNAVTVNKNPTIAYLDKKNAKNALVTAITNIQSATPKKPDSGVNYMIKHIASGFYLATDAENVVLTNTPSTIKFIDDDNNSKYTLFDENNGANKYIYKQDNGEGPILTANATNNTEIAFRIIFINGIPSHIALTYSGFEDGTCLGTENIDDKSKVFCNKDAEDGYSRWIITTYDPTLKAGDKSIWYNLEAGAFIEEEKYTPAANDLDGKTVVITDMTGSYTLAVKKNISDGNEWDMISHNLSNYNANQYLFAKFAKVTDSSVSGDNIYTIQMLNAQGEYYSMWGNQGYMNFQPTALGNAIFALGLIKDGNKIWGQDAENHGLWRVTYHDGLGYVIQNVGRGDYLNPASASPSTTPVYVKLDNKFLSNSIAEFGNDAVIWTIETEGSLYKLKNVNKYLSVVDDASIGIHSFMSSNSSDNSFTLTPAGTGYDYNVYTMSMNPDNSNYGSSTYGETYLGWSGESNYKPLLPLISKDDAEPRGIHWMKCSKEDYNSYKSAVKKARSARMNAWPVIRSAIRNGVSLTEFNKVYNNPMAVSGDIGKATATLREQVVNKVLHATPTTPYDASYEIIDAECQSSSLTEDEWTVSGDITRHDNKPIYETIGGKKKMILGGYSFKSESGNAASISKQITKLTPGKYSLALDINATKNNGNALSGLKLYIKSNSTNEVRADISGVTGTTSTIKTPTINVADGETVTIGLEIEAANNISNVAFDNFKLIYCDTYRNYTVTTVNDQKTVTFDGIWRATDNSEISDIVSNQGKGVTIDLKETKILDPVDITLAESNTTNVLVYTGADMDVTINSSKQNIIKDGVCTSFVAKDGATLNIPTAFTANNVLYSRSMSATTSYGTIVLPFDIVTDDEIQLYSLYNAGGNGSFNIERINSLPAGTPGFFRKKDNAATNITISKTSGNYSISTTTGEYVSESTAADDNFKLVGSYVYCTVIGDKDYADAHKNDNTKPSDWGTKANKYYYIKSNQFWQGYNYFYIDTFRAYIDGKDAPANQAREVFSLTEWEMPNDIYDIVAVKEAEIIGIYTSNGTKIDDLKPGVNIIKYSNGKVKKVFIK